MIKHFVWASKDRRGRVAVKVEDGKIVFAHIGGYAPPATMMQWSNAINDAFSDEERDFFLNLEADRLHSTRANKWRVERRVGVSGCVDYKLRVLKNAALANAPG